jgi:NAD(P)-dependent dehydrogenase (short-subunit alcohol dehydrogenase family)
MMSIFRDHLLRDRVAFVTGGGTGIGRRMAERFAEHGARVVLAGRRREKLDEAVASIRATGGEAYAIALDVRNYAAVEAALAETHARYGEIDVLLCAAAGNFPAPVTGISSKGFQAVVDIDLMGTFHACRAAYPWLRKPGASVLCVSANQATIPMAMQAHVCAAKAGVEMLTRTLAIEWGPAGIRANCITPGGTDDTEGMARLAPGDKARAALCAQIPLRRLGTKDELADLALFLASDAAAYITGSVYLCDGGQSLCHGPLPVAREL